MEREKARKKYLAKYKKIYALLLKDNKIKIMDLIERLADTCVYLDECNEHLSEEGLVVPMPQGDYFIMRENPYSKTYNDKMKLFNALVKQLDSLMPTEKESKQASAGDALAAFIEKGK